MKSIHYTRWSGWLTALFAALTLAISSCTEDEIKDALDGLDVQVAFEASTGSLNENASEAFIVKYKLKAAVTEDITAIIKVTNGENTEEGDYVLTPAAVDGKLTVVLKAGETEGSIEMMPVDNEDEDGDKSVKFEFESISKGELLTSASSYTLDILDDEKGVTFMTLPYIQAYEGFASPGGGVDHVETGWQNVAHEGSRVWRLREFSNNKYVEFTAFSSDESSNIGYLISPKIKISELATKKMSFKTQIGFGDVNTKLELLYSSDYAGSIADATWENIPFTASTIDNQWTESGEIDLSGFTKSGYLAFRYTGDGTDTNKDASFRIDDLIIGQGKPTLTVTENITDFGSIDNGEYSSEQSFMVSGINISGDVTITAPSNFQIGQASIPALLPSITFGASVVLSDVSSDQTIYVRFSPASGVNGEKTGEIVISASGVDETISVSGTEQGNDSEVLFFEETFEYGANAGDFLNVEGGANWSAHSGAGSNPVQYANTSLSLSGYSAGSSGGSLQLQDATGSMEDISRLFPKVSSGSVYAALLIQVSATAGGDYFCHFRNESGAFYSRLSAFDVDGSTFNFGISESGETAVKSSGAFNYGQTYLVVIEHDIDNGKSSVYVMDSYSASKPESATIMADTGTNVLDLAQFAFRGAANNPAVRFDGLRIANTWGKALNASSVE